jgi:hypothetical protein
MPAFCCVTLGKDTVLGGTKHLLLLLLLLQNKTTADGRVARLTMTSEDERQLLAENPALRQVYEAQVKLLVTCHYVTWLLLSEHTVSEADLGFAASGVLTGGCAGSRNHCGFMSNKMPRTPLGTCH